jgi:hypothetical protein
MRPIKVKNQQNHTTNTALKDKKHKKRKDIQSKYKSPNDKK